MKHLLKTHLSQLLTLPIYVILFFVFFIVASQPAFAITGEVLDQNGKSFSGATVTETYGSTTVTQTTTASGYSFDDCIDPAITIPEGESEPITVTLTVPSGYYATTATSVSGTDTEIAPAMPGPGCAQQFTKFSGCPIGEVECDPVHHNASSDPTSFNFGITSVPPDCTTTPINCSACTAPANTCSNGNGTQTCTLSQPQTCSDVATTQSCTLNNCTGGDICTNQACVQPTYTISGNVFVDSNKDGIQDGTPTESNYPATAPITSPNGGTLTTPSGTGSYRINGLTAGTYTVTYGGPPTGYYMTSPLTGPPISFKVTVGTAGCSVNGAPGATCTAGNITNLSFGISNTNPWFQSTCGDIRNDNGISDNLPTGQYGLITATGCSSPGIAFTGNLNASFGSGNSSTSNQVVGGATNPELSAVHMPLETSYTMLSAKATTAGITPVDLSKYCQTPTTLTNCNLEPLSHGIYLANGNLTIANASYTFATGQNYVILVSGNLTLNGTISIPVGSTVLFSTGGSITVNPIVGAPTSTTTTSDLDGWYVAGTSFILPTAGNCTDLRLNIAGSMVVNALGTGGTFQNNRDLCGSDTADPTVSFIQRLDMILNAPQFIEAQQTISQEVAP